MSVSHPIWSAASGLLGILEVAKTIARCIFVEYSVWERKKVDLVNRRIYSTVICFTQFHSVSSSMISFRRVPIRVIMWTTSFNSQFIVFVAMRHGMYGRIGYHFLPPLTGYKLCKTSWLRYLGIGKSRMLRTGKRFRGIDERTINQGFIEAFILDLISFKCSWSVSWWIFSFPMGTLSVGSLAKVQLPNRPIRLHLPTHSSVISTGRLVSACRPRNLAANKSKKDNSWKNLKHSHVQNHLRFPCNNL